MTTEYNEGSEALQKLQAISDCDFTARLVEERGLIPLGLVTLFVVLRKPGPSPAPSAFTPLPVPTSGERFQVALDRRGDGFRSRPHTRPNCLGGYASRFMQCGTDYIRNVHFGSSVQHPVQALENFRVAGGVIGVGILFRIPQTDRDHVCPTRERKRDFILKPLLSLQDGQHIAFESLREVAERVGLQTESYIASVHVNLQRLIW